MIAGISYNVFNGEEHLLSSIRNIRPCVDYVNVVTQKISNIGDKASSDFLAALDAIRREGLADEIIDYMPNLHISPVANEFAKRRLGFERARSAGVSHFMTMDADEYYVRSEFVEAKKFIADHAIAWSAVSTFLHIKRPIWRSSVPDTTCCSFLSKIDKTSDFEFGVDYPVLVDPTRRLRSVGHFYFFPTSQISMYHMNLVRLDGLRSKLKNSSSAQNREFISSVRKAYSNWRFGDDFFFPGKPPMSIVEVPDQFGIDHIFSKTNWPSKHSLDRLFALSRR